MEEKNKPEIQFHFRVPAQLRFSDVDRFGHMNNSVYFSLFDMCKMQYLHDVVAPDVLEHIGIVVANINVDFLSPIFFPDEIAIDTAITYLGNKSFVLVQRAINTRTLDVKCICRSVMVAYDINENKSIPMPDEYKKRIADYEGNPHIFEK